MGMLNYYIVSARSLAALRKRATNLGKKESHRIAVDANMSCEYMGLYDTYYVCGPLKTGALLGYSGIWGKHERHRSIMSETRVKKALSGRSKGAYVLDVVYAISSQGIPKSKPRMVEATLLFEHNGTKDSVGVARELINSLGVKRKITRDLRRQVLPSELGLIGFWSIRRWQSSSVGLGQCFRCNVKDYAQEFAISRLLHEDKKPVFPKPLR